MSESMTREAALRIALAAKEMPGVDAKALVRALAEKLDLPRRAVFVLAGETGRIKKVHIPGLSADTVRAKLGI